MFWVYVDHTDVDWLQSPVITYFSYKLTIKVGHLVTGLYSHDIILVLF